MNSPRAAWLAFASLLAPVVSPAAVTVTWTQVGGTFHGTVSGSFAADELAQASSIFTDTLASGGPFDAWLGYRAFEAVATGQNDVNWYAFYSPKLAFGPASTAISTDLNTQALGADTFCFFQYNVGPNTYDTLMLALSKDYVPGAALSMTLVTGRSKLVVPGDYTLSEAFQFGDLALLNGSSLITYSNGGVVPEPLTYGVVLGGLALAGAMIRRRRCR